MDKKSFQLGMNYSTARNRLGKAILFELVIQSKRDVCFRCGRKIKTPEELSLDHMRSWLNIDPALFWDTKNIAFSHLSCNSSAGGKSNAGKPRQR